ncbi:MAG: hypothetical protein LBB68_07790 [Treponema sp.]|jgi:hypothetical protein|nr:hypothetical protein [Treponema sp.]
MGKTDKKRRVYTKEFKAEAGKPIDLRYWLVMVLVNIQLLAVCGNVLDLLL